MKIIPCPSFPTVEEAVDYLTARGCIRIVLWLGSDGLVRGNGSAPA